MSDSETGKRFLMNWARYTMALASGAHEATRGLADDAAAMQQLQAILQTTLATDAQRREVALRMALAEFQVWLEHA